ncbi:MAG: hypothetical protein V7784_03995 [Oceanospirillaceae bacterium]
MCNKIVLSQLGTLLDYLTWLYQYYHHNLLYNFFGYGDVTPIGKIFGGLITIIGMGMVALPAGILASGFSAQLKRNRSLYILKIASAYDDGILTNEEKLELKEKQLALGISDHEAEMLFKSYHSKLVKHYKRCPHCDHLL